MVKKTPNERVLELMGSQREVARIMGLPITTVSYWFTQRGSIPAERAVELEKRSKGRVPRHVARPDLWEAPSKRRRAS